MVYLRSDVSRSEPIIHIQNFSLIKERASFVDIPKDELLNGIWEKAVEVLEQITPQIS